MIRVDSIWLATEPMDMCAGTETALARVIAVFGAAKPHCAYLFANRGTTPTSKARSFLISISRFRGKLPSFQSLDFSALVSQPYSGVSLVRSI
nr:hypothetical protein [uncultured Pseudomonas sp.]